MLKDALVRLDGQMERARMSDYQAPGLLFDIAPLDRRLRGAQRGELMTFAGRPGHGKSTLIHTIIANVCERSLRTKEPLIVGFMSTEMTEDDLVKRWVSMLAEIPAETIENGQLSDLERDRYTLAKARMGRWPLLLNDNLSPTIKDVEAKFAEWAAEAGDDLALLVLDHMGQVLGTDSRGNRYDSDYRAQSELVESLQSAARELSVPVIGVTQLSRKVEDRPNKRPQSSDLKDSGKIEEKSHKIVLVYRKAIYDSAESGTDIPDVDDIEVITAKGRNVRTGTDRLAFEGMYPRIAVPTHTTTVPNTI